MVPNFFVQHLQVFSPDKLPGVLGWIDASNFESVITDNSNNVSQINDLSGNGNTFTQSTSSNRPAYDIDVQNGRYAMRFNVSSALVSANGVPSSSTLSFGFLFKSPATITASSQSFFIAGTEGSGYVIDSSGTKWIFDWGRITGDPFIEYAVIPNTWYRLVLVFNHTVVAPNDFKLYLNNINVANDENTANDSFTASVLTLGKAGSGSWTNYICEFVYGNAAWDSDNVAALDDYWTSKWNI